MTTVSNWDATSFFERLTDTNILARNKKFRFCKVSGLQGFEDALATLQTTTAFVCVSDTAAEQLSAHSKSQDGLFRHASPTGKHGSPSRLLRYYARTVPAIYVGTHPGADKASGTLSVSRSAHPLLGDTRVFRIRLRLCFVPSGR